ncbi:MAG: Spy/CpxP family protein refolding chaperone [Alphaproteobacteria bacterium]
MKKILLASVCATGILFGLGSVNAEEDKHPYNPPKIEKPNFGEPHQFGDSVEKSQARLDAMDREKRGRGPSPEMREKMEKKMAAELGLTEEQQVKAKEIREEGRKKVEPLMKEMQDIRVKMDEMRKENMAEFEAILTPEQKAKLETIKAEHKRQFKHKNFPHPRDGKAFEKLEKVEKE